MVWHTYGTKFRYIIVEIGSSKMVNPKDSKAITFRNLREAYASYGSLSTACCVVPENIHTPITEGFFLA